MRKSYYSDRIKIVVLENGLISTYTAREALMNKLVSLNYEVYVLTHTNQYCKKVEEMGIKVINIGSANFNPLKIGSYIFRLWQNLQKINPDLCLTFSVRPTIWGNLISRILGIPVITNITGTGPLFTSNSLAYRFIRTIYPLVLQKTETVFFQNSDDRDQFISNGFVSASKCRLIPGSGVDHQKFSPIQTDDKDINHFTFLYIGRLLKDKGVPEFVEAAKKVRAKHSQVKFKIIGPVWKQNSRANMISQNTVNSWVSNGIVEYEGEKNDVREDIALADCIVLPSHREGTSNVLLEASSMERPCIATDVPGCREIVEDGVTGFLCKLKDHDDLAIKMENLLSLKNDDIVKMGIAARHKVMREFDKQIVINHYLEAIDASLNRHAAEVYIFPRHSAIPSAQSATSKAV